MPLDGHAFLTAQGWQGKGSGLRQGAIHRPIAAPLKVSQGGVGKDKVEAFAFWEQYVLLSILIIMFLFNLLLVPILLPLLLLK